jgi:hypothetical protein
MSEMRRMAKLLVERRSESFRSRYPRDESVRRVEDALKGFRTKGMVYETAWREEAGASFLDVRFAPSRGTRFFLNSASLVFTALLAASAWALFAPGENGAGRALTWIGTIAGILVFPLVVVAYGSRRDAEEATLRRRVKKAIVDDPAEAPKKSGYDDDEG